MSIVSVGLTLQEKSFQQTPLKFRQTGECQVCQKKCSISLCIFFHQATGLKFGESAGTQFDVKELIRV
jgi:hypothetical protein